MNFIYAYYRDIYLDFNIFFLLIFQLLNKIFSFFSQRNAIETCVKRKTRLRTISSTNQMLQRAILIKKKYFFSRKIYINNVCNMQLMGPFYKNYKCEYKNVKKRRKIEFHYDICILYSNFIILKELLQRMNQFNLQFLKYGDSITVAIARSLLISSM